MMETQQLCHVNELKSREDGLGSIMNLVIIHEGAVGPEDDSEGMDREDDGE